jgi:hypothetical protein
MPANEFTLFLDDGGCMSLRNASQKTSTLVFTEYGRRVDLLTILPFYLEDGGFMSLRNASQKTATLVFIDVRTRSLTQATPPKNANGFLQECTALSRREVAAMRLLGPPCTYSFAFRSA